MNNPEEIKMGLDAAGFNPNIPQAKPINNNTNINNADKKVSLPSAAETGGTDLNLQNTVNVNFNATKTSSKELKNVNIFEQESVGKTTMKNAAESIDLVNGPLSLMAKDLLTQFKAV
jgi:hypothetical protein